MIGLILQSRGLEAAAAVAAGLFALVVVWKSADYVITNLRNRREDRQSGEQP